MKCGTCKKEIDEYEEPHYELWRLAMPAHQIGYMCIECHDKRWTVRAKKFLVRLWEKIKNKG